jgi:hypothetical protein
MPQFRLKVLFETKSKEGEASHQSYDLVEDFSDLDNAEKALEYQISTMVSDFSTNSLDWTLLEKNVMIHTDDVIQTDPVEPAEPDLPIISNPIEEPQDLQNSIEADPQAPAV